MARAHPLQATGEAVFQNNAARARACPARSGRSRAAPGARAPGRRPPAPPPEEQQRAAPAPASSTPRRGGHAGRARGLCLGSAPPWKPPG